MSKWGQILIFDPDDKDRRSKLFRFISAVLSALIVFGGWTYTFISSTPVHGNGTLLIGKLHDEFGAIPVPEGASGIDGLVVNSKSSSALIEQRYIARPFSYDVILAHYDRQLQNNGWVYHGSYSGGSNGGEIYCKDGFKANVQFGPKSGPDMLEYSFSMSWTGDAGNECSRKLQS